MLGMFTYDTLSEATTTDYVAISLRSSKGINVK